MKEESSAGPAAEGIKGTAKITPGHMPPLAWFSDGPPLTLRDYFAASFAIGVANDYGVSEHSLALVSDHAYKFADAMLERRKQ